MKNFKNFNEALAWQVEKGHYDTNKELETGIENIDRIQFPLGDVFWIALADGYYLDDYEEWVTQYGFTASGKWAAVGGGHCSCYGWEEMVDNDITYYDSLEVLLKADSSAEVIMTYKDTIEKVLPFLKL
jgi:hypothetical protein|tara:strand:+ start:14532 stop:14918 length:387 start_codon:yes stop_codon:yes gene_type:complete